MESENKPGVMEKIEGYAKAFMAWFDGKKTVIGFGLLALAEYVKPELMLDTHLFGPIAYAEIMRIAGQIIGGFGVAHKLMKGEMTSGKTS